jgi:L-arabinokinase
MASSVIKQLLPDYFFGILQMPIKEACHVAVQRSPPTQQRLWKHTRARMSAQGGAVKPVICMVSGCSL